MAGSATPLSFYPEFLKAVPLSPARSVLSAYLAPVSCTIGSKLHTGRSETALRLRHRLVELQPPNV
jgi:hypothetical protein